MKAIIAALLACALAIVPLTAARSAPPDLLPLSVANNSGHSDQVFLYVVGVDPKSGRLGHVNESGEFTPWPAGSIPPSPAPDVAISGPARGATTTVRLPRGFSGRMYFSFGERLKFFLTPDGLVQPAPWNPSDPNAGILFDWTEFTYNDGGLWLNSSQVDMFSIPHSVAVTGNDGATKKTSELRPGGRQAIFDAMRALPGDWPRLVNGDLRVLAPGKGMAMGVFNSDYYDPYTTMAWDTYRSQTLTVVPFQNEPDRRFFGRTDGNGVMRFTDGSGAGVASFNRPSTRDVFGCDGALQAPNDLVVGPIARSLCAALQRSTLGFEHTQPTYDPGQFYRRDIANHYSRIMHEHMVDGRAYGFPFDDVGGLASVVHAGDPRSAEVVLTPF